MAQTGNLRQLRDHLEETLLRALRAPGGRTPATITLSARPAAEAAGQAGLKERCQERDGHRCVISGIWDPAHRPEDDIMFGSLNAAHIIPFALGSFSNEVERQQINAIWGAIYRYFPSIRSRLQLEIADVNREENILTLYRPLHELFGAFHIVLEKTETRDRYHLKTFGTISGVLAPHLPRDGIVTLRSHDGRYPLPDPSLLALHAAIGNILHATGSAERIEKILRDFEGASGGLAPDGSTDIGSLLSMRLLSLD